MRKIKGNERMEINYFYYFSRVEGKTFEESGWRLRVLAHICTTGLHRKTRSREPRNDCKMMQSADRARKGAIPSGLLSV